MDIWIPRRYAADTDNFDIRLLQACQLFAPGKDWRKALMSAVRIFMMKSASPVIMMHKMTANGSTCTNKSSVEQPGWQQDPLFENPVFGGASNETICR